ncbi:hypothetical protein A4G23_00233 [Streptomyces rubrolavendulae]|jgi:hypothetical protein|uniref:Uncharacterized protein n=2 Tax=Streptomyces TaxID=1883 RepID=A0A1D8FW91_9ACTN|nr:hypothetical protein A4G23_00233 [Streptomyces rubrolavendulae]OSY51583.1 hypothetical protein BG846_02794 [Streptomyces fradiae ATCC 10745 = DSM 40063]
MHDWTQEGSPASDPAAAGVVDGAEDAHSGGAFLEHPPRRGRGERSVRRLRRPRAR